MRQTDIALRCLYLINVFHELFARVIVLKSNTHPGSKDIVLPEYNIKGSAREGSAKGQNHDVVAQNKLLSLYFHSMEDSRTDKHRCECDEAECYGLLMLLISGRLATRAMMR